MELREGSHAGPYEILALLGSGGMGAVYRARDTKLGRDVAIKVLSSEVALVPERLARFRREAQVLASLNHPHIAAIHGLEEVDGQPLLILELVEGEDLSAQVARGAIPTEEALQLARQVAEAIESAHEKGIIHRDLKPGNIKVTEDGTVKVLDFGLAKVFAGDGGDPSSELSRSPTFSRQATAVGVILGTAAYMSPEQAKGKSVDKRCDIWAFGCVLYEMLTGRKAFSGETVSETFAEILKGEPDWSRLPNDVPSVVRDLLRHCLTKDPKHRLRDIGDAWEALNETTPAVSPAPRAGRKFPTGLILGVAVVASALSALVTRYASRESPASGPTRRFTVRLEKQPDPDWNLALSPDGARLAYVARADGVRKLFLRNLDEENDRVLPGTEDAGWVFFSPDGEWIGFLTFSDTQSGRDRLGLLKKVSVTGGAPIALQEKVFVGTATWSNDDTIVFQSGSEARLERISSGGGTARPLNLTSEDAKTAIWYPDAVVPGGETLLAMSSAGKVAAFSLTNGKSTMVVDAGAFTHAEYVPSGHVVYFKKGKLLAVPFDGKRLVASGAPVPVAEGMGPVDWAFSREGTLVYGLVPKQRLVWVSRSGVEERLAVPAGHIAVPRVAPDGSRITLGFNVDQVENPDIWLYDLARATMSRLTSDPGRDWFPLWSPDGKKVFYHSNKEGGKEAGQELLSISADGTGGIEHWLTSPYDRWPYSWSHHGENLVFEENNPDNGSDIGMLSMDGKGILTPVIRDPFDQTNPAVSPDGRLLAYESNESGRLEVYVQRFPELGEKRHISNQGGMLPLWGRDSRELFYLEGEAMMVVSIEAELSLQPGVPRVLFRGNYLHGSWRAHDYDRRNDRFLMLKNDQTESESSELHFVVNWFDELKRLAPAK